MTTATEIKFDVTKAMRYMPRQPDMETMQGVKRAHFVNVPSEVETIIMVSWNLDGNYEPQKLKGPWYVITELNGTPNFYGTPKKNFEETHFAVDGVENGFSKGTPIEAYQHEGPDALVATIMDDGTTEREPAIIKDGDWFVRWPHGETGIRPNDGELDKLYDLGSPEDLSA